MTNVHYVQTTNAHNDKIYAQFTWKHGWMEARMLHIRKKNTKNMKSVHWKNRNNEDLLQIQFVCIIAQHNNSTSTMCFFLGLQVAWNIPTANDTWTVLQLNSSIRTLICLQKNLTMQLHVLSNSADCLWTDRDTTEILLVSRQAEHIQTFSTSIQFKSTEHS